MRKYRLPLVALLLILLAVGGCWLRGREKPATDDHPEWANLSLGERVYRRHCAQCHGNEGKGDGPDGARWTNPQVADYTKGILKKGDSVAAIRSDIVDGNPPAMPPIRTLSEEELKALIAHVRSLVRPGLLRQNGFDPEKKPEAAPPLKLTALDGKPITLESLRGKAVLLFFWMSSDAESVAELPELLKLANDLELGGVRILAVCVDQTDAAAVKKLAAASEAVVFLNPDGQARKVFQVEKSPTLILLDREGRIIARARELFPSKQPGMKALLKSVGEPY